MRIFLPVLLIALAPFAGAQTPPATKPKSTVPQTAPKPVAPVVTPKLQVAPNLQTTQPKPAPASSPASSSSMAAITAAVRQEDGSITIPPFAVVGGAQERKVAPLGPFTPKTVATSTVTIVGGAQERSLAPLAPFSPKNVTTPAVEIIGQ